MKDKDIHKGHRERMKKRYMLQGVESMNDHEILELLLFYAIPRRNTNELSHKLIEKFGSISAVFDAGIACLREVEGIGESAAMLITMVPKLARIYLSDKHENVREIDFREIPKMVVDKYVGVENERLHLLLFDVKKKLIFSGAINEGNSTLVEIYTKKIVTLANQYNARFAIIAHNHPSGNAMPSSGDIKATNVVKDILKSIDVKLIDHLIVADGDYVSLLGED